MANEQKSIILSWIVLVLLSAVWGSSFILIKKALIVFSPQQVGLLRLSISGLAFTPFLILILKKVPRKTILPLLVVGIAGSGIPAFLFPLAQQEISSSLAGILNSMTPLFTLILGIIFFRLPFSWGKVSGVILGLAGAAFLIVQTGRMGLEGNPWYSLLAVVATVSYGISSNTVKAYLQEMRSLHISAVSFIMVGLPSGLILFTTNFTEIMTSEPEAYKALAAVGVLALIGTVAASVLFFRLVQMTTAVFASSVAYVIPIVALLWGIFDGEYIGLIHLMGMALILSGIYILRN